MKKPFLIGFTLVCSGLLALAAAIGLLRVFWHAAAHPFAYDLLAFVLQAALVTYLALVLYGLLKRPAWGRAMAVSFAAVLTAYLLWNAIHPSPSPVFKITPAQEGGAFAGRILMVVLGFIYSYKMALGSDPVRRYFAALPPRRPGVEPERPADPRQTRPD